MNTIIKIYGLPRSGTNLLHFLFSLNFYEPLCGHDHHGIHYLGWKHSKPSDVDTIKLIEKLSNVSIKFIFIIRNFDDWKQSILDKHIGIHPFTHPTYSNNEGELLYQTPNGFEKYENFYHLYTEYINSYSNFINNNPDNSLLIAYEDLQMSQEDVIIKVKEKFNLSMVYKNPMPVYKTVQMNERL